MNLFFGRDDGRDKPFALTDGTGGGHRKGGVKSASCPNSPARAYGALMRFAKNIAGAKHTEFENYFNTAFRWTMCVPATEGTRIRPRIQAVKTTICQDRVGLSGELRQLRRVVQACAKAYGRQLRRACGSKS